MVYSETCHSSEYTLMTWSSLDDVVVFLESLDVHVDHLLQVFELIARSGLKLNLAKCSFAQSQTRLLGHAIGKEWIEVDPEKTSIIWSTPEPRTKAESRSFLGLAGYYRRFIPKFAEVSASLHAVTSTKVELALGKRCVPPSGS